MGVAVVQIISTLRNSGILRLVDHMRRSAVVKAF